MDLGIKGRRAIVCASSKGLGRACAMALANEGVHVTLTARGAEALKKTADEIRKAYPTVTVTEVAGDITTPAGREAALKACPDPDTDAMPDRVLDERLENLVRHECLERVAGHIQSDP